MTKKDPGDHGRVCPCDACAGRAPDVPEWQREMMRTIGWYAHQVETGHEESPTGFSYHTHGLPESFGHPDLEIVFPSAPGETHRVGARLVELVKAGRKFAPLVEADDIIEGQRITFARAAEGGREILRVILPGPDLVLDRGRMAPPYGEQWEGTAFEPVN